MTTTAIINDSTQQNHSTMLPLKTRIFNAVRKIFTYRPFEDIMLLFLKGTRYLGFWSRFIPNPSLYPFHSIRKVERGGINYSLDLSCMMQWYVYWDFKARDREKLYSLVKPGDVIFDVGTNIGETLLNFARLTGKKGYVYGFEPDDENYANVQKNMSLNKFENVHVFKKAVSDKIETVKLFVVEPHNRGMNRILEPEEQHGEPYITLEATTLDAIVAEKGIHQLDLIKIDIEGYEMHALRGARQTLSRFRPKLFIEVGYTRLLSHKTSPNELVIYLESLGYEVLDSKTDERIRPEYDFAYLGDGGIDVVAIHKS